MPRKKKPAMHDASDSPQVEQPGPTTPDDAEPIAEARSATAEEKAPVSFQASTPEFIATPTFNDLVKVINIQSENMKTLAQHVEVIERQLGVVKATRDGKLASQSAAQIPTAGGGPPGWVQDLIKTLLPLGISALTGGGQQGEKSDIEKMWENYMTKKKMQFMDNLTKMVEASDEGKLWIGDRPPEDRNPDAKAMR